jgi:LPXTG-motif cell wall-anchored protein
MVRRTFLNDPRENLEVGRLAAKLVERRVSRPRADERSIAVFRREQTPLCTAVSLHVGVGKMDTTTLLVIVLVVLLIGGGGFFYRRRA